LFTKVWQSVSKNGRALSAVCYISIETCKLRLSIYDVECQEGKLMLVGDDGMPVKPMNVDGQASSMDHFPCLSDMFSTLNTTTKVATAVASDTSSNNEEDSSINMIKSDKLNSMGHVSYVNRLNGDGKLVQKSRSVSKTLFMVSLGKRVLLIRLSRKVANFRTLIALAGNGAWPVMELIILYPVVENYVKNAWSRLGLINRWNGETIVLGDFNEVRFEEERFGSIFNQSCARDFNLFISSSSLVDVKMEGYSFTWVHPSAKKMSKLDRFLVSEGIILGFPAITAVCLDRHLSDHRPILLKEIHTDFGPTPFRTYHSWFSREGFDAMVEQAWSSFTHNDSNRLIRFKKKLQDLKSIIRGWVRDSNSSLAGSKNTILKDLGDIDKALDNGCISDELLVKRMELLNKFHELNQLDSKDAIKKAKVKWAIEGDENSKFFHGIINKRRSQLAIRGVFVSGDWHTDPSLVKDNFLEHFSTRFKQPYSSRLKLSLPFPTRL
ncbi:RNA-directed DNA polymerase, eukaryota, partial [Tanacetum coccineum]